MNAKELKEKLTVEHILELMADFDTEPRFGRSDNELIFRTVCHGGDSHKLYFYKLYYFQFQNNKYILHLNDLHMN